ncbi:hypothetical protein HFO32_19675 [Rhizobium leguminosarum]|nr:hypothetical protein [Rhizobium leguminosarum]MBY5604084.1 hypothetical protein [Rhizobium leguminosarum]MBY5642399.1 hypothetical protein [Rhizobium leguminosarum]MBY5669566.1 hypothetical protein [Rhizobium leguminosarum]MBY5684351.1 hypothetical protein [Rhizobium leguminosarum]
MSEHIKRQMRRRSAIEPVIGHLKEDHRMGRNHLAGTIGDAANAILAALGYNFRRILAWIRFCIAIIWAALALPKASNSIPRTRLIVVFHGRLKTVQRFWDHDSHQIEASSARPAGRANASAFLRSSRARRVRCRGTGHRRQR